MITVVLLVSAAHANNVEVNTTSPIVVEQNATVAAETSTVDDKPSYWSSKSIGEKAIIVVGVPIVAVGAVVTAIVVAPVYIIKKIFE